jgi:hypothetical protein
MRSRIIAFVMVSVILSAVVLGLIMRRTGRTPRTNGTRVEVGGTDTPTTPPPAVGGPLEVSITSGGGWTPWGGYMRAIPTRLVGGVLYTGSEVQTPIGEGPALQPIEQQQLSGEEVELLRTQINEAGLLSGQIDFGLPAVTDNETTHIVIREGDKTYEHAIYALGFGDDASTMGITDEQFGYRRKIRKLLSESVLNGKGATEPYRGDRLVIVATRVPTDELARQNTASREVSWPGPDVLKGGFVMCLELSVEDSTAVIAAMEGARENTIWTTDNGPWQVSGHVLTANERPCAS